MLKVPLNEDGFFMEAHMKLRPVDFATDGIFMCGTAHYPKFIDESIAQAEAAASRAMTILARDELTAGGPVSRIKTWKCSGCGVCWSVCPYQAIEIEEFKNREGKVVKKAAKINEGLCQGCGTCVAICRSKSIDLQGYSNNQVYAEVVALLNEY